jgi:hypothetical protein
MLALGVIEADIRDALAFLSGNGRLARGPDKLLPSVQTARAKRIQRAAGKPSEKPYRPEDHASEVYS